MGAVEAAEAGTDENSGPVGTSCERILGPRLGKCILTTATVAETNSSDDEKERREGGFFSYFQDGWDVLIPFTPCLVDPRAIALGALRGGFCFCFINYSSDDLLFYSTRWNRTESTSL